MLKLTKKVEYGLIALNHMRSSSHLKSLHSAKEISETYSLPKETLAKILQLMVRFNYIHAVKGANGGYYIDKSIENVNLMDFIENSMNKEKNMKFVWLSSVIQKEVY